jgi:hypothetical protein
LASKPRSASGPGVGLAYDVAATKLADQHEYIGRLNGRLGGILAAVIAVIAAVLPIVSNFAVRAVAGWLLLSSLIEVARASRVSYWNDAPDPRSFARYAGDYPDYMKEVGLPAILKAFDYNQPRITVKTNRLTWSITFLTVAVALLAIGRLAQV